MEVINNSVGVLAAIPAGLLLLGGIIIALLRWGEHPQVSLLAVFGLGGLLGLKVVGSALALQLLMRMHAQGMPIRTIGVLQAAINITTSLLEAGAWACLLAAIFGWRRARATPPAP